MPEDIKPARATPTAPKETVGVIRNADGEKVRDLKPGEAHTLAAGEYLDA